jgi:hypothetical protein
MDCSDGCFLGQETMAVPWNGHKQFSDACAATLQDAEHNIAWIRISTQLIN